jgi:glycosyltransferase involved in cell wall biosynthesis
MNPRISVVIPTYNRADKVRTAVESALLQTVSGVEVIVVDDGSTDGTGKLLEEHYGGRIRYFAQPNQGVSVARNKGISEAQGEWIAFLDSDDFWEKDKLEWQLKALEQFGPQCAACYTDGRFDNNAETRTIFVTSERFYRHEGTIGMTTRSLEVVSKLSQAFCIWPSSLIVRADVVRQTGGFDPNLRCEEDSDFLFRLAIVTNLCYVNLPLFHLDRTSPEARHRGVSSEWDRSDFKLQQIQYRLEKRLRLSEGLSPEIRRAVRQELHLVYKAWANWYLETGQYDKARAAVAEAAKFRLTSNIMLKWLLTWVSPGLALRIQRGRARTRKHFLAHLR